LIIISTYHHTTSPPLCLPTITNHMSYNERKFTSDFYKWLRKNRDNEDYPFAGESLAIEYKTLPHKKRLNWKSDMQPQQIPSLHKAKHECVYKKLTDLDPGLKPCDSLQVCGAYGLLIVCWYQPRKYKRAYVIDIDVVISETEITKSLTQERASQIADHIIVL